MDILLPLIIPLLLSLLVYFFLNRFLEEHYLLLPKYVPVGTVLVSAIAAAVLYRETVTSVLLLSLALFIGLCFSFWPWVYTSNRSWLYFGTGLPLYLIARTLTPVPMLPGGPLGSVAGLVLAYLVLGTGLVLVRPFLNPALRQKPER